MSTGSSTGQKPGQKKSPFDKTPTQNKSKTGEAVKDGLRAKGVGKGETPIPKGLQKNAATVAVQQAKTKRGKPAEKTPVTPAPRDNSPQPQPSSSPSSTSPLGCRTFADWSAAQTGAPPIDKNFVTRYLKDEIRPKVDQLTKSNKSFYGYLSGMYEEALSAAVSSGSPEEVDGACAILLESVNSSLGLVQTVQSSKVERERKEVSRTAQEKEAVAKERKPGLGKKWGQYNKDLVYQDQTVFSQYVPADTHTIAAALKSQNIMDAVFHKGKAFWVGIPGSFELASYAGKAEMRYHFSEAGAKSLMEDYLLCASGDFADDNDQTWAGESAHPFYTLWKANEVGAYGIGASRLAELAGSVTLIEAFDPQGKKIVLDK